MGKVCLNAPSWSQTPPWLGITSPCNLLQLDVKEAKIVKDHPQWDISDDEEDKANNDEDTEEEEDSDYSSEDDDDD